ncbi:hypothetical protein BTA51_11325 [Hahella sp. CCB-MM4]|uniref:imm11 family protein n=1 Tax=Hahella sp. (strain CCB-MM4) TaxID=1926491 RepID=UPI000B9ADF5B|nr:DUF1629 domain-containing protein [Hahella sp. CCB-MM4]OZG73081.1 hypothetical protein BTA51_11325 [Hahella sp. CCB-MM4]
MIYRIHHDDQFLTFEIPTREVLNKLGRAYPFHINRSPIEYAEVWKEPLHIVFRPPESSTKDVVPDLAEVDGELFISSRAYDVLKNVFDGHGEFLPVTFEGGSGYLFNVLTIAEKLDGLDSKLTGYDKHGNLEHFGFREDVMGEIPVFRAEIDSFQGIFCSGMVKELIEENRLTGVYFHVDLANPVGDSYGTAQ